MDSMLNVAVGLIFVYLILSLLCTTVGEALEQLMKYRAHYLRMGIERLLFNGDAALRQQLYAHPLVKSLYTTSAMPTMVRTTGPSYIPSRQFVLALLDVVTKNDAGQPARSVPDVLAALSRNEAKLPPSLVQAIRTIAADAGDDLHAVKAGVERWFDGTMDRVSGWYKRRAQTVALVIGLAVAVGLNADTLQIVHTLSNDAAVKAALVAAAQSGTGAQSTEAAAQLQALGLPIGRPRTDDVDIWRHLLGWTMTGLALSLGAPFWFDLLGKFMVVRSTVKPPSTER